MAHSNTTESPLEAAAGVAGPHAVDAFKLLGDKTRLAILLALWEAYDPFAEDNAISFSELYDRVDMDDTGNFTYHLDKLTGHFVEETDEGYELREAGLRIVQAVIAGTGLDERTLDPTEVAMSCFRCGAPVEISYEDGFLHLRCTECEGKFGPEFMEGFPTGTLERIEFPPAGLVQRTPGEVYAARKVASLTALGSFIRGVCPECSGAVTESVQFCESHEAPPGQVCSSCGTTDEVRVRYVCSVCKYGESYPADAAAYDHPAINAFCYDQGIDLTYHVDDPEACVRLHEHHQVERNHTLVSTDPVRIRVTVPGNDATLHLILDGDLDVIEVTEQPS